MTGNNYLNTSLVCAMSFQNSWIKTGHQRLSDQSLREMANFRTGFVQAHPLVRSMILQPLFDKDIGILSEPEMTEEINRMILGEKYDEPLLRRLFEAYLDAVPEGATKGHLFLYYEFFCGFSCNFPWGILEDHS